MKSGSIARRLIASVLLIQLVSALSVIAATLGYERHVHFQAFDMMLRGRADSLLGSVEDSDDEADDVVLDRRSLETPPGDVYEVVESGGHVLGRSTNWKGIAELRRPLAEGISRATIHGKPYRLICLHGTRTVDPLEVGGGTPHALTIVYGATTAGVWTQIRQAVVFYAGASCVLLVLTGTLVLWVLRRGLLPLRELALEAEGLSVERWSFSAPESARSTEELFPLVTAFEAAVRRLEQSFAQQGRFVSDAAHELKTSVAVVKSSMQVLTMRPRTAAEYEAGLLRSLNDLERLEEIVGEMLTLARFENRAVDTAAREEVELRGCLAEVARQFEPMAELRQVSVRLNAPVPIHAQMSREGAMLLCSNLIVNALQHSTVNGKVELAAAAIGSEQVEVSVTDDGEGIADEVLPYVFERFFRGDPSRGRKTGGTGLGLAICRAIVQRAGGTIVMKSVRGEGTSATVRLPRAEPRLHAAAVSEVKTQGFSAWVNQTVPD